MPDRKRPRVVALMTIRNEEQYLPSTLEHLFRQGVETCLIDNGSIDGSLDIARSFLGRGVFRIEHLPFGGSFELYRILRAEEDLSRQIEADWFVHHDADEIHEAPPPYGSLSEGIADADRKGYNAVNFKEFVFLPTEGCEMKPAGDFIEKLRHYYFFQPRPLRLVRAWKNTGQAVELAASGGHEAVFEGRKIFPQDFILRHYIILDREHAIRKYVDREYSREDIERGWHRQRRKLSAGRLCFPAAAELHEYRGDGVWDASRPRKEHLFLRNTGTSFLRRAMKKIAGFLPAKGGEGRHA